jgi:hypothetical protein
MKIGDFGKIDDSKKSWPVGPGCSGLQDPHWKRVNDAKGLFDNGKEETPTKRGKK